MPLGSASELEERCFGLRGNTPNFCAGAYEDGNGFGGDLLLGEIGAPLKIDGQGIG